VEKSTRTTVVLYEGRAVIVEGDDE
jgi:hypothetical protein